MVIGTKHHCKLLALRVTRYLDLYLSDSDTEKMNKTSVFHCLFTIDVNKQFAFAKIMYFIILFQSFQITV